MRKSSFIRALRALVVSSCRFVAVAGIVCVLAGSPVSAQEVSDPFEPLNRKVYWVNDKLDRYLLEPLSEGYEWVMPDRAERGVRNFFLNLRYPRYAVSDVLQLKFGQLGCHTARFLINSTIGLLGIFDVASEWGLEDHEEDIGTAFGYWGVGSGPYMVLPFFGPSNVRDTIGLIADTALDPFFALEYYTSVRSGVTDPITVSGTSVKTLQKRVDIDEAIETARESSVDEYLFVQSAYEQYRKGLIYDGMPPEEEEYLDDDIPLDGGDAE